MASNLKVISERMDRKGGHIEAGKVLNVKKSPAPKCDTMFLRFRRNGDSPLVMYLRPDEAMDIAWVLITSMLDK